LRPRQAAAGRWRRPVAEAAVASPCPSPRRRRLSRVASHPDAAPVFPTRRWPPVWTPTANRCPPGRRPPLPTPTLAPPDAQPDADAGTDDATGGRRSALSRTAAGRCGRDRALDRREPEHADAGGV
jgi:hypothetical protein